jgi:hypothetical protein
LISDTVAHGADRLVPNQLSGIGDDARVALFGEAREEPRQNLQAGGTGGAAFVCEDDDSGRECFPDTADGVVGIANLGVVTAGAPEDEFEAARGELAMEREALEADRRTKPTWRGSAGGPESGVAPIHFLTGAPGAGIPVTALWMRVRVVAERVPAADYFGDELRMRGGFFADDKERGAGAILVEQIERTGSGDGVGAVVDGEPDLAAVGAEAADGGAEAVRGGHEKLPDEPWAGTKKNEDCEGAVTGEKKSEAGEFCHGHVREPELEGAWTAEGECGVAVGRDGRWRSGEHGRWVVTSDGWAMTSGKSEREERGRAESLADDQSARI